MKLAENKFTQALKKSEKQIGLWLSLRNNFAAEAVATSGYDWLLIDMEHTPNDLSTVLTQLQTVASGGSTAIVRPPWNDTVDIKRLLDSGAPGLLIPMVQSVEEAEQAVAATRYPPRGVRGVTGTSRANAFGRFGTSQLAAVPDTDQYQVTRNEGGWYHEDEIHQEPMLRLVEHDAEPEQEQFFGGA